MGYWVLSVKSSCNLQAVWREIDRQRVQAMWREIDRHGGTGGGVKGEMNPHH